jgi:hypothetical protein
MYGELQVSSAPAGSDQQAPSARMAQQAAELSWRARMAVSLWFVWTAEAASPDCHLGILSYVTLFRLS